MDAKRIILKLSGETLGENGRLFDHAMIDKVAEVLVKLTGRGLELGVVIGAGNIWRGRQGGGMDRVTADQMGMLGTVINCLCMKDAVKRAGGDAVVMSAFEMLRVCEVYNTEKAREYMKQGKVVLFAGGSGNPFFSTDTAVVLRAVEVQADMLLLAKNVDGVYDSDPKKNPNAKLIKEISYEKAQSMQLKVMDSAAFALCAENRIPLVRVFGLFQPENILDVLDGSETGTFLRPEAR